MSLRDRIRQQGRQASSDVLRERYGVTRNPFPSAGQPSGHPHKITNADSEIERRLTAFERDHSSQVLVIEGTQGVGKTNLLNYYEHELELLYEGDEGAYIIRYYPDPEPSFDGVLRRIFQELGSHHLEKLGEALAMLDEDDKARILQEVVRSQDTRNVLGALANADADDRSQVSRAALEWLIGLRLLKNHRELLGVYFRLDTIESKTQALRDIIEASLEVECLKGMFLLLDELEKQDLTLSKTIVLRYLLAIRALIDALPRNFFMMIAVTPEAKRRYFEMVPAFQGRLQNSVVLRPLMSEKDALEVFHFYMGQARQSAKAEVNVSSTILGDNEFLTDAQVKKIYLDLRESSAARGVEGVTHRDFLNVMHDSAEKIITQIRVSVP